jgi:hypothetical protein
MSLKGSIINSELKKANAKGLKFFLDTFWATYLSFHLNGAQQTHHMDEMDSAIF